MHEFVFLIEMTITTFVQYTLHVPYYADVVEDIELKLTLIFKFMLFYIYYIERL